MTEHTITLTTSRTGSRYGWKCSCGRKSTKTWFFPGYAERAGAVHGKHMRQLQKGRS